MRGIVEAEFTEFSYRLEAGDWGSFPVWRDPGLRNWAEWSLNPDLISFAKWVPNSYLPGFLAMLI